MIQLSPNPLLLGAACVQVSCLFDPLRYTASTAQQLGILLPAALGQAVQKRKAEFIAGRYCARLALQQLGSGLSQVGTGQDREPLWPERIVGSITHANGYASAAVGSRTALRGVGIDTEKLIEPAAISAIWPQVLTPGERQASAYRHLFSPSQYLTLVFSAKESLYKCLFPLTKRFFEFHAALIVPTACTPAGSGGFRFELLEDLGQGFRKGYSGEGSYCMQQDKVHTAVLIAA